MKRPWNLPYPFKRPSNFNVFAEFWVSGKNCRRRQRPEFQAKRLQKFTRDPKFRAEIHFAEKIQRSEEFVEWLFGLEFEQKPWQLLIILWIIEKFQKFDIRSTPLRTQDNNQSQNLNLRFKIDRVFFLKKKDQFSIFFEAFNL